MWKLISPAKINIFLEIVNKKDNMHLLHSLFCKIDLQDEIAVLPNGKLTVVYNNKEIDNDIILKTTSVLRKHFPEININFAFDVTKKIPIGAGLGGGSSNAATALKFLIEQNGIDVPKTQIMQIAKEIGSDVPFFLYDTPMILNGTATELTKPLFKIPPLYCVIAHPEKHLLTKDVFAKIIPPYTRFRAVLNVSDAISRTNEMQTTANLLTHGAINKTLSTLFHPKALTVKMSGSGSACFALFKEEHDAQECFNKAKKEIQSCFLSKLSK